ncbi:MAG TPA: hypothetical protein VN709_00800 [Terriglobales bacterium]|nr:hypothetical protein [Terriglobales bacterium]
MPAFVIAARDGAAVALLLGATISGAQWLLRRIYGESDEPAGDN